jgi:hypothetical protein
VFSNGGLQAGVIMIHFYDTACTHFWHRIIDSFLLGKNPPFFSLCADLLLAFTSLLLIPSRWSVRDFWLIGVFQGLKRIWDHLTFQGKVIFKRALLLHCPYWILPIMAVLVKGLRYTGLLNKARSLFKGFLYAMDRKCLLQVPECSQAFTCVQS